MFSSSVQPTGSNLPARRLPIGGNQVLSKGRGAQLDQPRVLQGNCQNAVGNSSSSFIIVQVPKQLKTFSIITSLLFHFLLLLYNYSNGRRLIPVTMGAATRLAGTSRAWRYSSGRRRCSNEATASLIITSRSCWQGTSPTAS